MEEEEKIPKGDDVVVELDASLEDLYMGGSLKVRFPYCILHNCSIYPLEEEMNSKSSQRNFNNSPSGYNVKGVLA